MPKKELMRILRTLWDYLDVSSLEPEKADAIIALGCSRVEVAETATKLYYAGCAPVVVCSGRGPRGARNSEPQYEWHGSEAASYAHVLRMKNVPAEVILVEDRSTNTAENCHYSFLLLRNKGIMIDSCLLVAMPYHSRRALATFKKQAPRCRVQVVSPTCYLRASTLSAREWLRLLRTMSGEVERLFDYPRRGICVEQEIPIEVHNCCRWLSELGIEAR